MSLLALVVLTEREWVGLFRECSIFEREEWYPEFGLAYDKLCWSQEWLSLVLAVSFLSWRHARHFPGSFLLSCACSAVVRACGRFARHVALWASTVSTFSTPCAFLSVYRLQLCELLFFCCHKIGLVLSFFPSLFGFRHFTKMWRRHGMFSGALFGLQALSDQSATILQAFVANRRSLQPRAVFEREDLLCELVHWMGSAKISARGVASLSIPELLFLTCVCPHMHGPPRAGPEGALRWVVRGRACTPMPPARGLHTLAALPPRQHGQKSQQVSQLLSWQADPTPARLSEARPHLRSLPVSVARPLTHLHLVAFHMTLHPLSRSLHSHSSLDRRVVAVHRRPPRPFRRLLRPPSRAHRRCALSSGGPGCVWPKSTAANPSLLNPPRRSATSTTVATSFASVPGLTRHITIQHAGSTVDEPTCALFVAIVSLTRPPLVEGFDARCESAIAVARPGQHRLHWRRQQSQR